MAGWQDVTSSTVEQEQSALLALSIIASLKSAFITCVHVYCVLASCVLASCVLAVACMLQWEGWRPVAVRFCFLPILLLSLTLCTALGRLTLATFYSMA
jgi:hypothetical protein